LFSIAARFRRAATIGLVTMLLVCSFFAAVAAVSAAGDASVSISPDTISVAPGEEFTLDVMISVGVQVRGAQAALVFDPTLLEVIDIKEGTFFKDWTATNGVETLLFPEPKANNEKGEVSDAGVAIMGDIEGGPTGEGVFLTYTLKAKDGVEGEALLELQNVAIADTNNEELPALGLVDGLVTVGGEPSGDGRDPSEIGPETDATDADPPAFRDETASSGRAPDPAETSASRESASESDERGSGASAARSAAGERSAAKPASGSSFPLWELVGGFGGAIIVVGGVVGTLRYWKVK
jgi:hypothetical protein